jgi:hypothetical protein
VRRLNSCRPEPDAVGRSPATTIVENGQRDQVDPPLTKTGSISAKPPAGATAASGQRVLNLSQSGAFGVTAAAGGATSVENVGFGFAGGVEQALEKS